MRTTLRCKLLVLAGLAVLLASLSGCDPGPIVWRVDAALHLPPPVEARG